MLDVRFWGEPDMERLARPAKSVENEPIAVIVPLFVLARVRRVLFLTYFYSGSKIGGDPIVIMKC
jgi:hypothetical protein